MNAKVGPFLFGTIIILVLVSVITISNRLSTTKITDRGRAQTSSQIPCRDMGNAFTCVSHGRGRCLWIDCNEFACGPRCVPMPNDPERFIQESCPETVKTRNTCARFHGDQDGCDRAGCAYYICSNKCRAKDYSHWFEECVKPNVPESECTKQNNPDDCKKVKHDDKRLCNWITCSENGASFCAYKEWVPNNIIQCDFDPYYNACITPSSIPTITPTPTKIQCEGVCHGSNSSACQTGYCYVATPDGYGSCKNRDCPDVPGCVCPISTSTPTPTPTIICESPMQCLYPCGVHSGDMPGGGQKSCDDVGLSCSWCETKQKCLSTGVTNKMINGACIKVLIESC